MKQSPYFYFSNLYYDSNDVVICVDEHLRIMYYSKSFSYEYKLDTNENVLINCYIPSALFPKIQSAIINQLSFSFDFECLRTDTPKKCFIFPVIINDEKFASLLLVDNTTISFERNENKELKYLINKANEATKWYSSDIIAQLRNDENLDIKDLYNNKIFIDTLKIRNEIEQIALFTDNLKKSNATLINANKYLKYVVDRITKLLDNRRFNIQYDFESNVLVTEIEYDTFDMLIGCAVTAAIKNVKGVTNLCFYTGVHSNIPYIIIGDTIESCEVMENKLFNGDDNSQDSYIPLLYKSLRFKESRFITMPNSSGGQNVAFTLPMLKQRVESFRQDTHKIPSDKESVTNLIISLAELF